MPVRIKPLNEYIIVKLDPEDTKVGSIHIPDRYKFPKKTGTVRAVGRGLVTESGSVVPTQTKPGDRVYVLDQPAGLKQIEHDGEICVILPNEIHILGIIEGEEPLIKEA